MPEKEEIFDKEFRQRIFDRFEKRSRTFSVTYRATIIFTFAFLAFVLVPLVALEYDNHRIRAKEADWKLKKASVENLQGRITEIDDRLPHISEEHARTQQEMSAKEQELAAIESQVDHIKNQIDKNSQHLNLYLEKARAFEGLQTRFNALGAYDPGTSARELIDAFDQMVKHGSRPDSTGPCASSDMYRFVRCKVEKSLQAQLMAYKQVITDGDRLLSQYENLNGVKPIDEKIDDVMKALDQLFEQYPDFWNTIRGKIFLFGEFKTPMNAAFREAKHQMTRYERSLQRQKGKIDADFAQLESTGRQLDQSRERIIRTQNELRDELDAKALEIQALQTEEERLKTELPQRMAEFEVASEEFKRLDKEKQAIVSSKAEIEARLEKVQSPFGSIPVRLKEAILVFPVIVAVGIVMYSLILMELLRLRKAFHRATDHIYEEDGPQVERRVAMVAPLWVDPLGSIRSNIGGSILLALPALAFFLSLMLIVYSWNLAGAQQGSTAIIQGVYIILYLLGAIGLTICSGLLIKQWKQY